MEHSQGRNVLDKTNLIQKPEGNCRAMLVLHLASHLLFHLEAELKKSPVLMDSVCFDGQSPRAIANDLILKIKTEFPAVLEMPHPHFNFIRVWAELNAVVEYDTYSFEAYNIIFYARLQDLHQHTDLSKQNFAEVVGYVFSRYDHQKAGFSVSMHLNFENNMREILRGILVEALPLATPNDFEIIFEQSKNYQIMVYEYFEKLLLATMRENEVLLNNILPVSVSNELREFGKTEPKLFNDVAIFFSDIVNFTQSALILSPSDLIAELNHLFTVFDEIMEKNGCERIKTVGDAYLAVCGMHTSVHHPSYALASAACDILDYVRSGSRKFKQPWQIRIGLHLGNVMAGIVGTKKYIYDVFGDAVNVAARMEQLALPMNILVSETLANSLLNCPGLDAGSQDSFANPFALKPQDIREVKGLGLMKTFVLKRQTS